MSHNSIKNFKTLKLSDIYQFQFQLEKFRHKFHHRKLPEIYNEFFQEISVHLIKPENYFIHQVSSNAGKKLISYRGASL